MKSFEDTCKSMAVLAVLAFALLTPAQSHAKMMWATYYGNGIMEATESIAMGPDGTLFATGFIQPPDWNIDIFVAQYSADGTKLLKFTTIDGGSIDAGFCIAVDDAGFVTVAGQTWSNNFPVTTDALQKDFGGGDADGILLRLNPNFEVVYATYFGGNGEDSIVDMAVDDTGAFVISGYTGGGLPVTPGAFQPTFGGGNVDAFVAVVRPGGDPQVLYATYLGGSGNDTDYDPGDAFGPSLDQRLLRHAVDTMPDGSIVVSGMTWSTDFPTTLNALQPEHSPLNNPSGYDYHDADMYVTVLDPTESGADQLVYSTYIGGAKRDLTDDLVVKAQNKVILAGLSASADFPVTANALQDQLKPGAVQNAIVVQMQTEPNSLPASQLEYSSYLGGSVRDAANGIYLMDDGHIVIGGVTVSSDYPTTDGSSFKGVVDMFMTRLDISRKPSDQRVFSTLIGGSGEEGLFVGPVGKGGDKVFFGGDSMSADFPGTGGTVGAAYDGVSYDAIVGRYELRGKTDTGAETLDWASYWGTDKYEVAEAVAEAADGTVVIAGFTLVFADPYTDIDAFVARFSADGTQLLNEIILTGNGIDGAFGLAIDEKGVITVSGQTSSNDFNTTENALQSAFGGGADGFLVQLSPNFDILYSTFFGGSGDESFVDIAPDESGGVVLCGFTSSEDLPVTTGAFQENFGGGAFDAFIAQIMPGGETQLLYSSYLGGSGDDADGAIEDERLLRQAVGVTPAGHIVVAGITWSQDFPVTPGAWQTEHSPITETYANDCDMYLTVLNPYAVDCPVLSASATPSAQLVYSTYLGGAGRDVAEDLVARNCADITLVGLSRSADFPTTANAYQPSLSEGATQNAVVVQLRPLLHIAKDKQLTYSTFLGGSTRDAANGVYQMLAGDIVVSGVTTSIDFPTTDGSTRKGSSDLFLTRLDPSRNPEDQMIFSTLFGGTGGEGLCVGPVGLGSESVFFAGDTGSANLPGVEGSYDETFGGGVYDAFVGRYDLSRFYLADLNKDGRVDLLDLSIMAASWLKD